MPQARTRSAAQQTAVPFFSSRGITARTTLLSLVQNLLLILPHLPITPFLNVHTYFLMRIASSMPPSPAARFLEPQTSLFATLKFGTATRITVCNQRARRLSILAHQRDHMARQLTRARATSISSPSTAPPA